jgi:2-polyprenyl-3-methyl-5-hydroxy-6-metoxy-1,4-benzoquinol methylase
MSQASQTDILELLPDWWWFRDSHHLDAGRIHIAGTIISKTPIEDLSIRCRANGLDASVDVTDASEAALSRFWFLPPPNVRGLTITYSVDNPTEDSTVELSTSADGHRRKLPFVQVHDWKSRQPVPAIRNIERVSGFGANAYNYFCNGASDQNRFVLAAADHGILASSEAVDVLDWGCGCGRLTRWFAATGKGRYVGIDIDDENVAWCRDNLSGASFETVPLYPPTRLDSSSFDLVIGNSVLTHLAQPTMEKWLAEIRRLVKPGGLALLSYHGDFSNAYFVSRYGDAMRRILDTGIYDDLMGKEMEGVLPDPTYYRQTYMSDSRAADMFRAAGFGIETVHVGHVSRCQNLAVLRPEQS